MSLNLKTPHVFYVQCSPYAYFYGYTGNSWDACSNVQNNRKKTQKAGTQLQLSEVRTLIKGLVSSLFLSHNWSPLYELWRPDRNSRSPSRSAVIKSVLQWVVSVSRKKRVLIWRGLIVGRERDAAVRGWLFSHPLNRMQSRTALCLFMIQSTLPIVLVRLETRL